MKGSNGSMEIIDLMCDLSHDRPLFHSEADFQHALAWHIHNTMPDCGVRLEYKPLGKRIHLDLWLESIGVAIELKYRTQALKLERREEAFELFNQSALPISRYNYLKDIQRLEKLGEFPQASAGYAIFLTNDPLYWEMPKQPGTIDTAFRLHEGRRLCGKLAWAERASQGTVKGRENPIRLDGSYEVRWRDYSIAADRRYGRFRYLAIRTAY